MEYHFFFLLLLAVLITAGCVSENKNTVVSTTPTTIQSNTIDASIASEPQPTKIKPSIPAVTVKPTANISELDPNRNPWDLCPDSKMNEQKCEMGIFTDQGYCDYWKKRVEITCSKSPAGFDAKQTPVKTVVQPQIIPPEKLYDYPFIISEISQSVVEKGDTIIIKGTSWKNPLNTTQVWIFGDKYAKFDIAAVDSDGLFTYLIKASSINPGKYYVLVQSPGIDNQFDIGYNKRTDEVRNVKLDRLVLIPITSASVRSFTLMDAKSPTGSEAFYNLKAVLDNSEMDDDLYSEVKFEIAGQTTASPTSIRPLTPTPLVSVQPPVQTLNGYLIAGDYCGLMGSPIGGDTDACFHLSSTGSVDMWIKHNRAQSSPSSYTINQNKILINLPNQWFCGGTNKYRTMECGVVTDGSLTCSCLGLEGKFGYTKALPDQL